MASSGGIEMAVFVWLFGAVVGLRTDFGVYFTGSRNNGKPVRGAFGKC